ncbi:MAG: MFS transporter [Patescibacteria group bacterium]
MKNFLNQSLKILLITNSLILIAGAMLGPIYALFVEQIGGDLLDASFAGGIFAVVAGITTLLAGNYADKIKENELIIVFGYFVMGIGFFLYIFVDSVMFIFIVQALIGFAEALYSPAFNAIYSKHLIRHREAYSWSAWEAMNYFTVAFGSALGGLIVYYFSFDIIFIIMAMLCFSSAIYIYFLPRKVL